MLTRALVCQGSVQTEQTQPELQASMVRGCWKGSEGRHSNLGSPKTLIDMM